MQWKSAPHRTDVMLDKRILWEQFCEGIDHHGFGGAWKELQEPMPGVVAKMMPCHIDVLRPWTKLGKAGQLEGPGVVLKNLAENMRLRAQDLESMGAGLSSQLQSWDGIAEGHGQCNALGLCG